MEIAILRGPRPAPGFTGLHARLSHIEPEAGLTYWAGELAALAAPLADLDGRPQAFAVDLLKRISPLPKHWLPRRMRPEWSAFGSVTPAKARRRSFTICARPFRPCHLFRGVTGPALLDTLMAGAVVRPRYAVIRGSVSGFAGSPAAAGRSGDPWGAERGCLAAGTGDRPMDEPSDAWKPSGSRRRNDVSV